jgi:hypothetical protein
MTLTPAEQERWESYRPLTVPRVTEVFAPSAWLLQTSPAVLELGEMLTSKVVKGASELAPADMEAAKVIAAHLWDTWYPYAQKRGDLYLDIIRGTKLGVSALQVEMEQFGIRSGEIAFPIHNAIGMICNFVYDQESPDTHGVDEVVWKMRSVFAVRVGHFLAREGDPGLQAVLANANAD